MTAGLVAAGIVVLAAIVIALRWRSGSGEQQALRHYQHALDTLKTVNDRLEPSRLDAPTGIPAPPRTETARSGTGEAGSRSPASATGAVPRASGLTHVESRIAPPRPSIPRATSARAIAEARASSSAVARTAPPTEKAEPQRASGARQDHDLHTPLVFDDDGAGPEPGAEAQALGTQTPTRASMRALQRSARPPSRVPAALGVFVVVVVIAVLAVLAFKIDPGHHTTTPTTTAHHRTTTPSSTVTKLSTIPTTTTTTAPPSVQPDGFTATTQGATYPAPSTSYKVTLASSGECWVYAQLPSTGAVVWTGELGEGQSQVLNATGELVVQLGHANTMSVMLNGVPVRYPAGFQAVFTMKFVPSTT
ncbi:MAG: RodZ domain-containing protein [Acidimicrobiales bacterium]